MIERLLENWLTRANERSFQIPFCHWLAFKGYTVVHLTRHCAMEIGKDIIAIDPEGIPCAYQLKGIGGSGKMSLKMWRSDLSAQLSPLVNCKIMHPSIPDCPSHRSILVINGEIVEEVAREIDDFNKMNDAQGMPNRKVEVILKGELFRNFKELQSDFWATNLADIKTYLEIFSKMDEGSFQRRKSASSLT